MQVELKNQKELKAIINAAFPNYRKKTAGVTTFRSGMNINSYWDGGSRDEYAIVHLPTMRVKALPTASHPFFDLAGRGVANQENGDVAVDHVGNVTLKRLPADFALVSAGTFCGKPATARVYFSTEEGSGQSMLVAPALRQLVAEVA